MVAPLSDFLPDDNRKVFCDGQGKGEAGLAVLSGFLFGCWFGLVLVLAHTLFLFFRKRSRYKASYENAAERNERLELDLNQLLTYIAHKRELIPQDIPKENLYKDPQFSEARRTIYKDMCLFFGLRPKQQP